MSLELVQLTSKLISMKTVTKENIYKCMEYIYDWLLENDLEVEEVEVNGYKSLISRIGNQSSKKTIVLNGHVDVVDGKEEQFNPIVKGDKLYGRGSLDMLGSVACMMLLARDLKKIEKTLHVNILFQFVPDEEIGGSNGTKQLVKLNYLGDFVICCEPTNMRIALQAKGVIQLEVEVEGKAAHGSRPWLGENAILNAVEIYNSIKTAPFTQVTSEYFPNYSVNLSSIESINAVNVVPDNCRMIIEIRFLPEQDANEIIRQVKYITQGNSLKALNMYPPVVASENSEFIKLLDKTLIDKSNIKPIHFGQDGTADSRFFAEKNIPSIEFGPTGKGQHGDEEYVLIPSLVQLKDTLYEYVRMLFTSKNTARKKV